MYCYRYSIKFDDVDAAGLVYYPRFFHLCHVVFEDLFNQKGPISYPKLIKERRIGFPTVHVEATFSHPLRYGDDVEIELKLLEIKNSSVVTAYRFLMKDGLACFYAAITTVCMDLEQEKSLSLPSDLREFLEGV
jgi:4-hydroxybenzoyl-CoA thioesterase